jgi:glycerol-3-phosphate acyltransferase PlsY
MEEKQMAKAFGTLFKVGAIIIALAAAVVLIFTYWEKIVSLTTAGARVATNILEQFTGDTLDDGEKDYYDI